MNVKVVSAVCCVSDPLVADMWTAKFPGVFELQKRFTVPEPVIGAIPLHDRPGATREKDTVPVKPFIPITVIVEPAVEPAFAITAEAETEKSAKLKVAVVG
jgi:hypothetical protein